MTSNWVTGSASAPPSAWGSFRANRPAWRMASTEGWASVPMRSGFVGVGGDRIAHGFYGGEQEFALFAAV